jgi:hypothetical protein
MRVLDADVIWKVYSERFVKPTRYYSTIRASMRASTRASTRASMGAQVRVLTQRPTMAQILIRQ